MARYQFTAVTLQGATVSGVEKAASSAALRQILVSRDLQPIRVSTKKGVLQFEITKKKVPRKELMHFSRQMAVFMRAGIPILDALDVITAETTNKAFKAALLDM